MLLNKDVAQNNFSTKVKTANVDWSSKKMRKKKSFLSEVMQTEFPLLWVWISFRVDFISSLM